MKTFIQKFKVYHPFLAFLVLICFSKNPLYAQLAASYVFTPSVGVFTPLANPTATSLGATDDDVMSTNVNIGFSFTYVGNTYTQFRVGSNGHLIFGTSGTSSTANSFTTTTTSLRPALAPLWDDLQCTQGVKYELVGTVVGSRVMVVEWLNMEWNYSSGTAVISFQVHLYEGSNRIEFHYRQESGTYAPGTTGGASIGLLGLGSTDYLSVQGVTGTITASSTNAVNNIGVKPATGQIFAFDPPPPALPPTPSTRSYSNVTSSSVVLQGAITTGAYPALTASGIVVDMYPNPTLGQGTVIDSTTNPVVTNGTFSKTFTGLMNGTTYYYRTYATNAVGTSYGPDSIFVTDLFALPPTVLRTGISNLSGTTVTVGGNITSNGGDPVIQSGIIYGQSPNLTLWGWGVVDSATNPVVTTGTFNINIAGLTHSTKYYYRAYAVNSAGVGYSVEDSFYTVPVISTLPYAENFDSVVNHGWTTQALVGPNQWVLGTPAKTNINAAKSGTKAWVTKLTGNYDVDATSALVSPQFDFSGTTANPLIRFAQKFITEANWDGMVVQISINNGAWTVLNNVVGTGGTFNTTTGTYWYNNNSGNGPINWMKFSGNSTAYTGHSSGWIVSSNVLTGAAGQSNVRIRFLFGSDVSNTAEGFAIDDIEIYLPGPPTVATAGVGNLTTTNVVLSGNITNNGGAAVTSSGIVVGFGPNPSIGDFGVVDSATRPTVVSGPFNVFMEGLYPGTQYYYRAFATNSMGTSYGADSTFITASSASTPTVIKRPATNVSAYGARVGGAVITNGGDPVISSGIIFNRTPNFFLYDPNVVDSTTLVPNSTDSFYFNLQGLLSGTKYYFKAYATNSMGTSYSVEDSFVTSPVVNTFPFVERFDSVYNHGWTFNIITGTVNDWAIGTPSKTTFSSAFSGPNALVTKLTGAYSNNHLAAATSPQIDFTTFQGVPLLRFKHQFITESCCDGAWVEISINGGAWTKLENVQGTGSNFNTTNATAWYNVATPRWGDRSNAYASQVNGWITSSVQLNNVQGQSNVRIRFVFSSDISLADDGWMIDDVEIVVPTAPVVQTGTATNVTIKDATISGTIVNNGGNAVTASGVVIGTSPNPVKGGVGVIDSLTNPLVASGNFSITTDGLVSGTTYYYRAYATNNIGTSYGANSSFTTPASAAIPTISGGSVNNVSAYAATINANIISDGGSLVYGSGILYSTNPNVLYAGTGVIDSLTNPVVSLGTFSKRIGGLLPSTTYYYKAYAMNSIGVAYTTEGSFTTTGVINVFPYTENFDSTTHSVWVTSGTVNDWVIGTPAKSAITSAYSGTKALVTGLTSNYSSNHNGIVTSPQFDFSALTGATVLQFKHRFLTESCCDGGWVEVSVNGGAWTKVENVLGTGANFNTTNAIGWYNNGNMRWANNSNAYASQINGWIVSSVILPSSITGESNVKFRFVFTSDGSVENDGWAIDDIKIFPESAPIVSTGTHSNLTMTNATVAGRILSNGGHQVTASGVLISTVQNATTSTSGVIDLGTAPVITDGNYSVATTALQPGIFYYYRAYATNSIGTSYGNDSTFITPSMPLIPTVVRGSVSNLGTTVATIGGNITSNGGDSVYISGVIYSTTPNVVHFGWGVVDSITNPHVYMGSFNKAIGGLLPSTTYYYKVYATNNMGTAYSAEDSFITLPIVSSFPYKENFDTLGSNHGWILSGTVNNWRIGTPNKTSITGAYSGPNALVTGLTGNYSLNHDGVATSPQFNFSNFSVGPILRFKHKFLTESCCDGGWVEYSINGGGWIRLENVQGTGPNFNTPNATAWYNTATPRWAGNSNAYQSNVSGWIISTVSLPNSTAGENNVKIRFRFTADGSLEDEGWVIDDIEIYEPSAPTVITGTHMNVTMNNASVSGNITDNGGNVVSASGVIISGVSNATLTTGGIINLATNPVVTSGAYTVLTTSLQPGTYYYYRAYATNAVGTSYGIDSVFITPAMAIPPTVSALQVTNITGTSATLGGNITSDGGDPVLVSGVVYSTMSNVSLTSGAVDSVTNPAVTTGTYNINIAGLTPATWYYYKAYAYNTMGVAYSAEDSFMTDPVISSFPYSEDFEVVYNGWKSSSVTGGINDWQYGTPNKTLLSGARSGTKAWATKLTGLYSNAANSALTSPRFDFSSLAEDPVLRFHQKFATEAGWDAMVVEISLNGGTTWNKLTPTAGTGNNFNNTNSHAWYNSGSNNGGITAPKFSSTTAGVGTNVIYASQNNGWIQSSTRLTGVAGNNNVRIRLRFQSDGSNEDEGFSIDDIEVVTINTPTTPVSAVTVTPGDTSATINFVKGNGQRRLIVARLATIPAVAPTNWTLYNANSRFSQGGITGANNYVVYNDTGDVVQVGGLTPFTAYEFDVYEYDGKYMHNKFAPAATGNTTTTPVTLVSFVATKQHTGAKLNWVTSSEINNSGFDIQRSVDGKNFVSVGFVKGVGNSNKVNKYQFIDEAAFVSTNAPVLYYRLRQVDLDGKETYTQVVSLTSEQVMIKDVAVYPNPFASNIDVKYNAALAGEAIISIVDMSGRTMTSQSIYVEHGANNIAITNLSQLDKGVYILSIIQNGETTIKKMVKN
jgi:hypothetical protein